MRGEAGVLVAVPLREQVGRVVGLVPDRVQRDLWAELACHGGHELLEVEVVRARDVGRPCVGRGPSRRRTGDRQQHLPVQALRFPEQRHVLAPVVVSRVGRFEARLASRCWGSARLRASRARRAARPRRGIRAVRSRAGAWCSQQLGGALEVGGLRRARPVPGSAPTSPPARAPPWSAQRAARA